MPTEHVRPVATVIAQELENAYLDALEFVADLHDVPPHEIRADTSLQHEVAMEAFATVAHRAPIAEVLAGRFAPRKCAREGCLNNADKSSLRPVDRDYCSNPCRKQKVCAPAKKQQRQLVAA